MFSNGILEELSKERVVEFLSDDLEFFLECRYRLLRFEWPMKRYIRKLSAISQRA